MLIPVPQSDNLLGLQNAEIVGSVIHAIVISDDSLLSAVSGSVLKLTTTLVSSSPIRTRATTNAIPSDSPALYSSSSNPMVTPASSIQNTLMSVSHNLLILFVPSLSLI
jgi:hypothetical protein